MPPKAVFFDLDDTLLWDKKSIELALRFTAEDAERKFGVKADELVASVRALAPSIYEEFPTHAFTKLIGINPFEGLWGEFGEAIHFKFREMGRLMPEYRKRVWTEALKSNGVHDENGGTWLSEQFIAHRKKNPVLYEETLQTLEILQQEGFRLLMLTNGAPSLQLEKLRITPELVPYFEHIVISGNVGVGKPDPAVFDHALRLMDLQASDVWMVGDNRGTDILGANRVNMKSVLIQHDKKEGANSNPSGSPDLVIERLQDIVPLLNQ
ncbi:HAD family hydrolase [Jeotgalibacillus sp. S-D1]|uniref:HAD family hydrolase n=1 Tax=Jeotgalibacillus sp. S-D1 TaxID=2552189 RepID=UPI00105A241A|nr:HAD-IA family hydrolase [Jeotgalibacillus sp. S-D1]TDL31516.1 HAD family hydrolase [Jeotgalibacillus sp. S-D1]